MKKFLILVSVVALAGCSSSNKEKPAAPPTSAPTKTKAIAPPSANADHVGVVAAGRTSVVVAKVDARVEKVYVRMGTWIEKGAPIAKLDDESLRPLAISARGSVDAARAAYRGASISVADARRRLRVERSLFNKGVTAKETVNTAQADVSRASAAAAQALAGLKSAEAEAQRVEQLLTDATLRSPMSGLVSVLRTTEGQMVGNGQTIVRIVDPKEVKIRFAVRSEQAKDLAVGKVISFKSNEHQYRAVVREVAPELEPPLQLIVAEADLQVGAAPLPRPGLVGTVSLGGS